MQKGGQVFISLKYDIFNEIKKLKTRKATQNTDIPVKLTSKGSKDQKKIIDQ